MERCAREEAKALENLCISNGTYLGIESRSSGSKQAIDAP